ncbi:MAG: HD domain-containing protein [Kiritimatiellae bacterium]|nr:HD domain-containing protein [Kiritimatiellia bacterium]MDD5519356.1 HD domain-containing protein [Kiritimatiellia bacterium]
MKKETTGQPDTNVINRTIERAKQELEHMIDLNPQVMLLVDQTGKVVRANRALLELLGLPDFKKILGKGLNDLFPCEDKAFFLNLLASKGGYDVREINVVLGPHNYRLMRFAVVSSDNEVSVIIVNDVTSEKEQAVHLEKKYKKEAIQALMGGLMHNVNQPLTVIMIQAQFMQLALEKGLTRPEDLKKELQNIMALTMQVADMLKTVERPKDFVTQPYLNGIDILDIKRSGDKTGKSGIFGPATLDLVMTTLEAHNPGTGLHARRTGNFAGILAENMGLPEKEKHLVERCAYFHDIGKIGIPDKLLQKSEALTNSEITIMKTHTEIGYNLLSTFPLLRDEAETAFTHHERCDGKGYPRGLKKKTIPLYARITAVADAFDALLFSRSYHPAIQVDAALGRIVEGSGPQFDPEVVAILKKNIRKMTSAY